MAAGSELQAASKPDPDRSKPTARGPKPLHECLKLGQVVGNLATGPVHRSDEFAAHYAFTIDDVGLGPAVGAVEVWTFLRFVAHSDKIDAVIFQKPLVSRFVGVDADPNHGNAATLEIGLHPDQRRHFGDTGSAPAGPEIEQDDLSAVLAKSEFAVGILHREVGGVLADAGWAGAAVASDQNGQ